MAGQVYDADTYWHRRERFFRKVVGHALPEKFYRERNALEKEWLKAASNANLAQWEELSRQAARQEEAFYQKWKQADVGSAQGSWGYQRYWAKKTEALRTSERTVINGD